jgi:hypothetical protein
MSSYTGDAKANLEPLILEKPAWLGEHRPPVAQQTPWGQPAGRLSSIGPSKGRELAFTHGERPRFDSWILRFKG